MFNSTNRSIGTDKVKNSEWGLGVKVRTFLVVVIANLIAFAILALLNFFVGWNLYLTWTFAISSATFVLFGYDKYQARRYFSGNRIAEVVFMLLALLGGAPGVWLGVLVFNHKKHKRGFIFLLAVCTVANGLLAYFFSQIP
ncbi:DUF1294 domain-containing protein [Candidatus Saccharibacteria bacterium]|nr:DUF1294 domain-containing protein [Candidatus Saccharibacteria bacterium]